MMISPNHHPPGEELYRTLPDHLSSLVPSSSSPWNLQLQQETEFSDPKPKWFFFGSYLKATNKNSFWIQRISWDVPGRLSLLQYQHFKWKSHWKPLLRRPQNSRVHFLQFFSLVAIPLCQFPFLKSCWVSSHLVWEIKSFSGTTNKLNNTQHSWGNKRALLWTQHSSVDWSEMIR